MKNQMTETGFIKNVREQLRRQNITTTADSIRAAIEKLEINEFTKTNQNKIVEFLTANSETTTLTVKPVSDSNLDLAETTEIIEDAKPVSDELTENDFKALAKTPEPTTGQLVNSTAEQLGVTLTRTETIGIVQQVSANKANNETREKQIFDAIVGFVEKQDRERQQQAEQMILQVSDYANQLRVKREQDLVNNTGVFLRQIENADSSFTDEFINSFIGKN